MLIPGRVLLSLWFTWGVGPRSPPYICKILFNTWSIFHTSVIDTSLIQIQRGCSGVGVGLICPLLQLLAFMWLRSTLLFMWPLKSIFHFVTYWRRLLLDSIFCFLLTTAALHLENVRQSGKKEHFMSLSAACETRDQRSAPVSSLLTWKHWCANFLV